MAQPQGQFNPLAVASGFDPKAAQISGALKSGYSGNKGLRFFGNVLAGLSNLRSGGLIGVGSTIADRMAQQSYIDKLEAAQLAETLRQNGMYTKAAQDLGLPVIQDPTTGAMGFYGGEEAFKTLSPAYTKRQTNQYLNDKFHGGNEDAGALADPSIINDQLKQYQDRRAVISDSNATMGAIPSWYGTGYDRNPSNERAWNPVQQAVGKAMQQAANSATPQGLTPIFQAGATATGQQPMPMNDGYYPLYGRDPFTIGVIKPETALSALDKGQSARGDVEGEKDKDTQLAETAKHNRAMEKIGMINATRPRGGGGSQNPYTILNGAQNYAQGQLKALEAQMSSLGFLDDKGVAKRPNMDTGAWLLDWDGDPAKIQASKNKQALFDAYEKRRQDLYSAISGAGPTFGGGSQQKLQNAGAKANQSGASKTAPSVRIR